MPLSREERELIIAFEQSCYPTLEDMAEFHEDMKRRGIVEGRTTDNPELEKVLLKREMDRMKNFSSV